MLGFTTIFVALGASASAINPFIMSNKIVLSQIAGAVIIVFGLHYMGLFRIALLDRDMRFHIAGSGDVARSPATQFFSPYVLGLAFAFGWTPCIGPILATILTIAAAQESLQAGAALLTVYSLGLGIPLIAAAVLVLRIVCAADVECIRRGRTRWRGLLHGGDRADDPRLVRADRIVSWPETFPVLATPTRRGKPGDCIFIPAAKVICDSFLTVR